MRNFIRWFNKEFDHALHPFEPIGVLFLTGLVCVLLLTCYLFNLY